MISIIICSRTHTINDELSENIKNAIGCDYELIIIDNSKNQHTIFDAYNEGIEKSTGKYLCFIHDDILFHTKGWGTVLVEIFNNNYDVGLIGIAGAKIKTKVPSAWWDCPLQSKAINIIQHFVDKTREKERWNLGFEKEKNVEAVVIDGVFMAMRKDDRIHFSTEMEGFHNYDLNISLEYKNYGFKIIVTNEILIEHFSFGNIDKSWHESTFKIHEMYSENLPLIIGDRDFEELKILEIKNAKKFINQCLGFKQYKLAFLVWLKLFWLNPFLKYHLRFWFNFAVKTAE